MDPSLGVPELAEPPPMPLIAVEPAPLVLEVSTPAVPWWQNAWPPAVGMLAVVLGALLTSWLHQRRERRLAKEDLDVELDGLMFDTAEFLTAVGAGSYNIDTVLPAWDHWRKVEKARIKAKKLRPEYTGLLDDISWQLSTVGWMRDRLPEGGSPADLIQMGLDLKAGKNGPINDYQIARSPKVAEDLREKIGLRLPDHHKCRESVSKRVGEERATPDPPPSPSA